MFTNIRSLYGIVGAMLALIALYLVLTQSTGAARLLRSGGNTANTLARTLQGR